MDIWKAEIRYGSSLDASQRHALHDVTGKEEIHDEHHHRRGDGRDDQRPVGVDQLQLYHKLIIADGEHLRGHHHHRQDKAPGGDDGACTGSVAHGWAPVGAMQFTLSLAPGASQTLLLGLGMGFRDSCQDLLGFVHMIPQRARERILDIAATQFPDGSAYHQYQPLTKKGNLAVGSGFNDDPLWLIAGTDAYLRETGDWTILDAPTFGEGKNSWLTGTAAWTFVSISQAILGVQPTLEGLAIDPCIPAEWAGYTVKRRYRGAVYRITVENPHHVEKGIASIAVDGTPITGNVLPPAAPGTEVQVRVVMG